MIEFDSSYTEDTDGGCLRVIFALRDGAYATIGYVSHIGGFDGAELIAFYDSPGDLDAENCRRFRIADDGGVD